MKPVQFGVFITPQYADIQRLQQHVHTAEVGGFDYVSVQDHPYSPGFLDTFALIGTLIGRTSRLRFMPSVANLPLRPPAMLAKTSAALDLLSGGRFELGLGGGRLWPQIAGLGGPSLTPGEVVTSIDEAITVLRALWAPGQIANFQGQHYSLTDVQTGPAPAHAIGIWLGALSPRMLNLIGRKADGWIATLATGYETKPAGQDRTRGRTRGRPRTHRHPPGHSARRFRHRSRGDRRAPPHRSGRPADPHHAGWMGTHHRRVRPRRTLRHHQLRARERERRATDTIRHRGRACSAGRHRRLTAGTGMPEVAASAFCITAWL
jgi:alkanesulfonate monooxygenase SsuD/methylene tetrahydromethanopterin reductase-like flavin-dependent oxidoreductase (luciferase family)